MQNPVEWKNPAIHRRITGFESLLYDRLNLFYMTGYVEAGILTSAAFSMPSFIEGEQSYLLCPPPSFWGII